MQHTLNLKAEDAKEHPITEGRTYLAEVIVDPWAYRKIPEHTSLVGQIVRVKASEIVEIQWASGGKNSCHRSNLRVLGEAKRPS